MILSFRLDREDTLHLEVGQIWVSLQRCASSLPPTLQLLTFWSADLMGYWSCSFIIFYHHNCYYYYLYFVWY